MEFVWPYLQPFATVAALTAVAYFLRERIAAFIDAGSKHRWDRQLEALKFELSDRGKLGEALRSTLLQHQTNRNAVYEKRRLEAVDQVWGVINELQKHTLSVMVVSMVKWNAVAAMKPSDREVFGKIFPGADIKTLSNADHMARPYISDSAWGLFVAYKMIVIFCAMKFEILKIGADQEFMKDSVDLLKLAKAALPDWSDYIDEHGEIILSPALNEIEKRLLTELKAMLNGQAEDAATAARAASIVKMANDMHADMLKAESKVGAN